VKQDCRADGYKPKPIDLRDESFLGRNTSELQHSQVANSIACVVVFPDASLGPRSGLVLVDMRSWLLFLSLDVEAFPLTHL
jgi:hypothetical protein